jgi:hypothetical protein
MRTAPPCATGIRSANDFAFHVPKIGIPRDALPIRPTNRNAGHGFRPKQRQKGHIGRRDVMIPEGNFSQRSGQNRSHTVPLSRQDGAVPPQSLWDFGFRLFGFRLFGSWIFQFQAFPESRLFRILGSVSTFSLFGLRGSRSLAQGFADADGEMPFAVSLCLWRTGADDWLSRTTLAEDGAADGTPARLRLELTSTTVWIGPCDRYRRLSAGGSGRSRGKGAGWPLGGAFWRYVWGASFGPRRTEAYWRFRKIFRD